MQKVLKSACIGVECISGKPAMRLDGQPCAAQWIRCHARAAIPAYGLNDEVACQVHLLWQSLMRIKYPASVAGRTASKELSRGRGTAPFPGTPSPESNST